MEMFLSMAPTAKIFLTFESRGPLSKVFRDCGDRHECGLGQVSKISR